MMFCCALPGVKDGVYEIIFDPDLQFTPVFAQLIVGLHNSWNLTLEKSNYSAQSTEAGKYIHPLTQK